MTPYTLVFINSLQASFLVSLHSDVAWFAALGFGGYNMTLATLAAVAGSTLGMIINFAMGYWLSTRRAQWFSFNEATYVRISKYFRRYFAFLLLFSWIPFMGFYAVATGLFRVPPPMAVVIIILGRIGYYGYYLFK